MITISQKQMRAFAEISDEHLCQSLMKQVRERFPQEVPSSDSELQETVRGWMRDARIWGFRFDDHIIRYVICCASNYGRRDDIDARLEVYLRINHEELTRHVDLRQFCPKVVSLAQRCFVLADEGVAWLAVIVLAGMRYGTAETYWIEEILSQPGMDEETRMHAVHKEAAARRWGASVEG